MSVAQWSRKPFGAYISKKYSLNIFKIVVYLFYDNKMKKKTNKQESVKAKGVSDVELLRIVGAISN